MYQNFQYSPPSPWVTQKEETTQEALGLEKVFPSGWFDVHGAEIAEIKEKMERLEKKLEEREKQQIIPIQFLDSEKLELQQPIIVRSIYSLQSNIYVVDHVEFNIYGEGRDEHEAIDDFKLSLEETYFDLKKDKDNLGPFLLKQWQLFNKAIKEK